MLRENFASFSTTLMEGWKRFGATPLLSVFVPYNLHFPSYKHSNLGYGVAEGVIAKIPTAKTEKTQKLCISEAIRKHCFSLCFCCSVNKTLKNETISKPTKSSIQFYRNSVIFRVIKMSQKGYTNNNDISCKKANKHSPQLNKLQLINFKGAMSRPAHVRDLRSTS